MEGLVSGFGEQRTVVEKAEELGAQDRGVAITTSDILVSTLHG